MSHIRDRLIQLKNEVENTGNGAYFSKNNISKIVELLFTDLEQDEKENGWIPVSERLRYSGRGHRKTEYDAERLSGRVRISAFRCRLVSLPEKYGDSGYGY